MRIVFANLLTSFVFASASIDKIVEDYRLVTSTLAHEGVSIFPEEDSDMAQITANVSSVQKKLAAAHEDALEDLDKVCSKARSEIDSINKSVSKSVAERRDEIDQEIAEFALLGAFKDRAHDVVADQRTLTLFNWNDALVFPKLQESAIAILTRDFEDSVVATSFAHIRERFIQVRQSTEAEIKQIFSEYVAHAVVNNIVFEFNQEMQEITDPAERAERHAGVVEVLTAMGFSDRIDQLDF